MREDKCSIRPVMCDYKGESPGGKWTFLLIAILAADVICDFLRGLCDGFGMWGS